MLIDAVVQCAGTNLFVNSETVSVFLYKILITGSVEDCVGGSLVNYAANCLEDVEIILSNNKEFFTNYQVIITKLFCIPRFKFKKFLMTN
jgi:hypothetical protein